MDAWINRGKFTLQLTFNREKQTLMTTGIILCTLGDPLSINAEGLLRTTRQAAEKSAVVFIGSQWQLHHQAQVTGCQIPPIQSLTSFNEPGDSGYYLLDPLPSVGCKPPLELTAQERGQLTCAALNAVPKSSHRPMAVVTAPIDKSAAVQAGFNYPGQTEFFEDLWQGDAVMLLAGPRLKVALATNHLALSEVPSAIGQALLLRKLKILESGLRSLYDIAYPRIAVCGLNPHAGDKGLFGKEDEAVITPAVFEAQRRTSTAKITGPIPADTAFYKAYQGQYDAVLAMYHDQGLGPLKTVHFDDAVNVSMGLKYLRVSPDHGPAADLYGSGNASFKSFQGAVDLCERWIKSCPHES